MQNHKSRIFMLLCFCNNFSFQLWFYIECKDFLYVFEVLLFTDYHIFSSKRLKNLKSLKSWYGSWMWRTKNCIALIKVKYHYRSFEFKGIVTRIKTQNCLNIFKLSNIICNSLVNLQAFPTFLLMTVCLNFFGLLDTRASTEEKTLSSLLVHHSHTILYHMALMKEYVAESEPH